MVFYQFLQQSFFIKTIANVYAETSNLEPGTAMKKAIVELTSAGITSEAELKQLVQAKKGKTPAGFAKTAPVIQVEKSVDPEPETTEVKASEEPLENATATSLIDVVPVTQMREMFTVLDERHQQELKEKEAEAERIRQELEQLKSQNEQLSQQVQQSSQELTKAQKDAKTLEDLGKLMGKSIEAPMVNLNTSIDASPKGLAKDLVGAIESAKVYSETTRTGTYTQRNGENVTRIIRQAKADGAYRELLLDVQEFCRKEFGMFKVAGPTTGATGSVPNGFLDVLSPILRETHNQSNIFWQFAMTVFDETAVPSKAALVPRFNYLTPPTNLNDYLLSTPTTFSPITAATGATSDSEGLEESSVPITIQEWGRGRTANTRPIYIPEFHRAITLFQLIDEIVDSRLMQNYFAFEDLLIRSQFARTQKVLFNDRNSVALAASSINAAGDLGTITSAFMSSVYGYLFGERVPGTEDNCYIAVLNPTSLTQYKSDLGRLYAPVTPDQMQVATSVLSQASGVNIGQVSGYFGKYDGFHVFASNAFGVGSAGAEGVASVALGGSLGTQIMRDNYFFGMGAVGRGIGMPMEIRPSGVNAYGRGESYIWLSHENTQTIDTDAAISNPAGQQTRVWRVPALDVAV